MVTSYAAGEKPPDPRRNAVLGRLPDGEYERLSPTLRAQTVDVKHRIHDVNRRIREVHFPIDAVFSLTNTINDARIEVATIGNESAVGLSVSLGSEVAPTDSFCQIPGWSVRLDADALRAAVAREDSELRRLLGMAAQAHIVQLSQNIACNRLHSAQQRASRWLLMSHDRVQRDVFLLTQEFLAEMLGVRRATASETASELRAKGLIRYRRGRLSVLDRNGLEALACECYRVVRDRSETLFNR